MPLHVLHDDDGGDEVRAHPLLYQWPQMRLENWILKSFLRTPRYPQSTKPTNNISRSPKEHPKPENTPSEHLKNSDKNTSMLAIMMLVMSMPLLMMMMMLTSMNHDQIRRADTRLRWLKPVAAKRSTGYSAAAASFKTHHHWHTSYLSQTLRTASVLWVFLAFHYHRRKANQTWLSRFIQVPHPLVSSREPGKSAAGWLGLNDVEYNYSYLGDWNGLK